MNRIIYGIEYILYGRGRTFDQIVLSYDSTFSEPYIHQNFTLVLMDGRISSVDSVKELYTSHLLNKSKIKLVSYKDIGQVVPS